MRWSARLWEQWSSRGDWCSGRFIDGQLRIVGSTGDPHQAEVAALLVLADQHPWPPELMLGWGTRERTPSVRVEPLVTVEVLADHAVDAGRWRHTTQFVRPCPDRRVLAFRHRNPRHAKPCLWAALQA